MTLTQKDFRTPLLVVLRTLQQDSKVVDHELVYERIFTMLGIQKDQYGEVDGIPATVKMVQGAFRDLRASGLGAKVGRGRWQLTTQGLAEAARLNTTAIPDCSAEAEEDLDGWYHPDPYIRKLALTDHPCYRHFSLKPPCIECIARRACEEARFDYFESLAVGLGVSEKTKRAPQKEVSKKIRLPKGARVLETTAVDSSSKCDMCHKTIIEGSDTIWIRGIGTDGKSSHMFHKGCYPGVEE